MGFFAVEAVEEFMGAIVSSGACGAWVVRGKVFFAAMAAGYRCAYFG